MPATYLELKFSPSQRKRGGEYRTCPQCGRQFYLPPARVARNETYCSKACELASKPRVSKVCPACGKVFGVLVSQADRYNYCSRACRTAQTKYTTCERCGKLFVAEKRLNRHYCSEECRRPPVYRECQACGTTMRVQPGDTDRQFCSFACYRRSRGENALERMVRQALELLGFAYIQEAPIGRYSIDFLLTEKRVALEVDGSHWHSNSRRNRSDSDATRTRYLEDRGWRVVRISDVEIDAAADLVHFLSLRLA